MTNISTTTRLPQSPSLETAWQDVDSSFERFCLTAGIEAIEQMLREDAERIAGARPREPPLTSCPGKPCLSTLPKITTISVYAVPESPRCARNP